MTHTLKDGGQVLNVGMLARVEGEGGMHIEIKDRKVVDVQLNIFEPPRFYEGFLRGRHYTEPPDITARICGICPVAYQSASTEAMEVICGVQTTDAIQTMRRLLYCGEWIESHALHIFMLHAPDFLGYDSVLEMAETHGDVVQMALRLKKCGNDLMDTVGGRAIHPVNVRVGGFYRMPALADLMALRPELERGLEDALAAVQLVSTFDFPDMEQDYTYVSLRHPDYYPLERGAEVVASSGVRFPVAEMPLHVEEFHVAHSNALHARFDGEPFFVGPLARYTLNFDQLSPRCQEAALSAGLTETCRNPFKSIIVRTVELAYAFEEALRIIDGWTDGHAPSVPTWPRAGEGVGASEAPRGTIWHRYRVNEAGIIEDAQIVPPTSQNQSSIEMDLRTAAEQWVDLDDHALTHRCEAAIRNYDPCISCATHFLDLRVKRS
ncbi:Ni/Fe hydrogenase subunit alpha [Demequina muriae]|uniref:Ni/Fe hydrogenase subunit alpha n=1 Tax=Demequina muriae TaxID=3051664 RepID=A0ABT8GEL1_9MICO|nr:Ni/Fe hydrogenase subunit alpha [Demequina sp. EGI L300058]MDN4479691.1 Ni/Fe hydrogenase subunit alpha [Demequina sp. EGI L300058]